MAFIHKETMALEPVEFNKYTISKCIKLNRFQFRSELNMLPTDSVILTPAYDTKGNLDYQICITGKVKLGETPQEGIVREIAEEIGLNLDVSKITFKEYKQHERVIYFSAIELTADKITTTAMIPSEKEDNFGEHICCFLYFRPDNWTELKDKIYQRKRLASSDTAGEKIIFFEKKHLQLIINKWIKNDIVINDKYHFLIKD